MVVMINLPFKELILEETPTYVLVQRKFIFNLSEEELIWHRDNEDREISIIEGDGWYIQMDNELPQLMQKESIFKIPKETWHRIINKNGTNLIVNVRKYK
jgi:quercetin dioxygenase-like cupin family protein